MANSTGLSLSVHISRTIKTEANPVSWLPWCAHLTAGWGAITHDEICQTVALWQWYSVSRAMGSGEGGTSQETVFSSRHGLSNTAVLQILLPLRPAKSGRFWKTKGFILNTYCYIVIVLSKINNWDCLLYQYFVRFFMINDNGQYVSVWFSSFHERKYCYVIYLV